MKLDRVSAKEIGTMDVQQFRDPPKQYREVPFWSWNDDLDPDELVRQVALMDEGGWGGFFMHARVGLRTPYLGQRWMACIRACVDAARERGMGAWLYDEDKWPSGFAGGLSVAGDPAHRAQYLVCKVDNRPALLAERMATFAAREVGGRLVEVRPDDTPELADDADRAIQFYPHTMPLGQAWFNDYAYLDLLNPEAVRAFLDSTHEVYAQVVGEDFGGAVPGVFTDEPCFMFPPGYGRAWLAVPWTDGFLAYFQARNGYDLLPYLPALFFDVGEFHGVRYDYWRTVTERFVESYTRPMYEWCEAHDLAYTGHYLLEDTLLSQTRRIGAAMPHYAYMHVPGIDKLGRLINGKNGSVLTVKQLDSVVCQLGERRALCENYGCAGQDFAHTGRKWIGDWAYVLGVNLNNPHLSLYSMRGERKRDFPQNIFYQQPWWPENHLIADYFARLSYALSQGQRVVDILVIHPIGSAWALFRPGATYAVDQLDEALDALLMTLMQNQRDFHLGDEMLMGPGAPCEARVTRGEAGPRLEVGEMSYRVAIVPPGVTLAENSVRLLREFAAAGGPVLATEPTPTLIDGRPADGPVLPVTAQVVTLSVLPAALDGVLPFDVRVPGRPAIWVHQRRVGQSDCYFLANTDLEGGGVATVQLRGTGRLEAWDPATGDACPWPSQQRDGTTEVTLDFPPVGSHLLVLHRDGQPVTVGPVVERGVSEISLDDTWYPALGGPNALTLDRPQVRVGEADGEEDWSRPMHVLDAHAVVARAGVGAPFALRFTFDAAVRPAGPLFLVAESPTRFDIVVNGQPVANQDAGWWVDISLRKVEVGAAVRAGRNEIVLSGVFAQDTELESVYLVGAFGVAGRRLGEENRYNGQVFDRYAPDFCVTEVPERVTAQGGPNRLTADLTAQGLPFFAGRATLRQVVTLPRLDGRTVLEIEDLRAAVAHVRVNGQHLGAIAWLPHQVDVTAGLYAGENAIEIELVGTLRNLLGPHHRAGGDLDWTGPRDFRDKSRWTDDYILVPFGFNGVTLTTFAR
jgi:hypothetical protein